MGLAFAWSAADPRREASKGIPADTNNTTSICSVNGVAAKSTTGQTNLEWNREFISTSNGAGTGDFTMLVLANPSASGAVVEHVFVQKNDAGGSPFNQVAMLAHANGVAAYLSGCFSFFTFSGTSGSYSVQSNSACDGAFHLWVGRRSGGVFSLFKDGRLLSNTPVVAYGTNDMPITQSTARRTAIGSRGNGTTEGYSQSATFASSFNRALSDAEIKSLSDNPWQVFASDSKSLWKPAAAFVTLPTLVQPASTTTPGAWVPTGAATLHAAINEATPNDAEYISVNSASTCEFVLAEAAYPGTANQTLAYRASSTTGSSLTVTLKQGATIIMSRTHALTATDTLYTQTLTAPEIASIVAGPINVTLATS